MVVAGVGALVGAPMAGAAGGLLNDVTAPLSRTAQSSDTSATGGLAPVVQTVANAAAPATSAVAPVVQTVAPVVETVADVAAPVTTAAAHVVHTVAKTAAPVVRTVVETTDPVVKPVATATAPLVQEVTRTVAPVTKPLDKALAPVTAPLEGALAPIVKAADPVVDAVAPVTKPLRPAVAAAAATAGDHTPSASDTPTSVPAGRPSPTEGIVATPAPTDGAPQASSASVAPPPPASTPATNRGSNDVMPNAFLGRPPPLASGAAGHDRHSRAPQPGSEHLRERRNATRHGATRWRSGELVTSALPAAVPSGRAMGRAERRCERCGRRFRWILRRARSGAPPRLATTGPKALARAGSAAETGLPVPRSNVPGSRGLRPVRRRTGFGRRHPTLETKGTTHETAPLCRAGALVLALAGAGTATAGGLPIPGGQQLGVQSVSLGDQSVGEQSNDAAVTQQQGSFNINVSPAIAIGGDASTWNAQGNGNTAVAGVDQSNGASQSQAVDQAQQVTGGSESCCGSAEQAAEQTVEGGDQSVGEQSNDASVTQSQGNGNLNISPRSRSAGMRRRTTSRGTATPPSRSSIRRTRPTSRRTSRRSSL